MNPTNPRRPHERRIVGRGGGQMILCALSHALPAMGAEKKRLPPPARSRPLRAGDGRV